MEVPITYQAPKGTEWDKIERYVDVNKLKAVLLNKFPDAKKHDPKYTVRSMKSVTRAQAFDTHRRGATAVSGYWCLRVSA